MQVQLLQLACSGPVHKDSALEFDPKTCTYSRVWIVASAAGGDTKMLVGPQVVESVQMSEHRIVAFETPKVGHTMAGVCRSAA